MHGLYPKLVQDSRDKFLQKKVNTERYTIERWCEDVDNRVMKEADLQFLDLGRRRLVATQTMDNTKRRFLQSQFAKTPKVTKILEACLKEKEKRPRSAAFSAKSNTGSEIELKRALADFKEKNTNKLKQLERKELKLTNRIANNRSSLNNARKSFATGIGESKAFSRLKSANTDKSKTNIRSWLTEQDSVSKQGVTRFLVKSNTDMRKQSTALFGVKWQKKTVNSTRKIERMIDDELCDRNEFIDVGEKLVGEIEKGLNVDLSEKSSAVLTVLKDFDALMLEIQNEKKVAETKVRVKFQDVENGRK